MYVWLGFSPKAAKLLVREQGLDSPEGLRVLTNKNNDDICNVMRKSGGKNADGTPDKGQKVSVIAQENLKLAIVLFHHRWRCTLDWEIMGVTKDTACIMTGQKKLNNEYKDPNVLPNGRDDRGHQRIPQIMLRYHKGTCSICYKEDHNSADLW